MRRSISLSLFSILFLFFAAICWGQSQLGSGAISGSVTDPKGLAVPGASVVVTNTERGWVRQMVSGPEGQFSVPVLPVGKYTVRVEKSGFAVLRQTNVAVSVGSTTTLQLRLQIGPVKQVVDVTAQAATVDTARTEEVSLVSRNEIDNLPLNGRRADQFALLSPGVTRDGSFGQLSYRGISGVYDNYMVDGNDFNNSYNGEDRGRTRVAENISSDAIQEFQVGTSNFLPEFGRAGGGTINAVTRSGSNTLHGDAFYFFRNHALSARDPFASFNPYEQRQQFGGSLGGPILKDKLFYFANYDQQIRSVPIVFTNTTGVFTNGMPVLPPNPTPAQQARYATDMTAFNAGTAFIANLFPAGNTEPRTYNQSLALGKVDYLINSKNTVSVSYNYLNSRALNGYITALVQSYPGSTGSDYVKDHTLNARLTTILSPRHVNELRFQWSRDLQSDLSSDPPPGVSLQYAFSFGKAYGMDRIAGPDERRLQFVDNFSYIVGSHSFKFGGEINRVSEFLDVTSGFGGSYTYTNALTFGRDLLNPAARNYSSFSQSFGLTGESYAIWNYAGFAQDQWRVNRRLTLNYGLRYDYEALPDPIYPNPAIPETAHFNADRTNFGPRVGAAYNLFGNGKTVIRGGYGIIYAITPAGTLDNALRETGLTDPTKNTLTYTFYPTDAGAPTYPNTFSTVPSGRLGSLYVTRLDSDFRRPRVQEWNVGVERELTPTTSVSVSYVYTHADRLPINFDVNLIPPNFARTYQLPDGSTFSVPFSAGVIRTAAGVSQNINASRPNPAYGQISVQRSLGESWYKGLLVEVNRRMSQGFQLHVAYTLSWADNLSGVGSYGGGAESAFGGSSVANQFDLASNRGRSATDQRHRLVVSGIWNLPFHSSNARLNSLVSGFGLSGVFVAEAGRPYSANINTANIPFSTPDGTQWNGFGGLYGQSGLSLLPTIERNSNTGPANYRVDLRVSRTIHLNDRWAVELMAEGFNVFNHFNPTQINYSIYNMTGTTTTTPLSSPVVLTANSSFGTPSSDQAFPDGTNARRFQIALRLRF